jgi:hypothetical protein
MAQLEPGRVLSKPFATYCKTENQYYNTTLSTCTGSQRVYEIELLLLLFGLSSSTNQLACSTTISARMVDKGSLQENIGSSETLLLPLGDSRQLASELGGVSSNVIPVGQLVEKQPR